MQVETDVLVIGAGAAGMYAAIEAARRGAQVFLVDRSLIGRGGATVMAQMTVAVALGAETPDHWSHHLDDTLDAGRGLCDEPLARLLCEDGPDCIREMDALGRRLGAPGRPHRPGDGARARPAALRLCRLPQHRAGGVEDAAHRGQQDATASARPATSASSIWSRRDGEVAGAVALHLGTGAPVVIAAKATVLATGGLTRLYRRNSASANMGGDGYALALRAGAPLVDMEFVQFFPDRPSRAAPDRHGPDHVGPVPLQARRPAAQRQQARSSPTATACRRTASTCSRATSRPTPSSRRSRPAAARRMAAPI